MEVAPGVKRPKQFGIADIRCRADSFWEEQVKTILGYALAAFTIATTGLQAVDAGAADFAMKISSPAPLSDNDALSAWLVAFEKGVEERSGGRIDVQLFPSSQLGPIPATVEGVAMGTIEMTAPIIGFLSKLDPRFQVLDAAGLFDDERHALRTLSDPKVREMFSEFGASANVEPLIVLTSGQSVLISKTAIDDPSKFSGVKLRTGGATPLLNKPMEALGAAPVALPLGETLPGIQTGTIDSAAINMPVAIGFKYADVAKEATYLPGNFTVIGGIVSKDFLASIGPELEAIVREEAENAKAAYADKLDTGPAFLEDLWMKQGGHLHRFTDGQKKAYMSVVGKAVEEVVSANAQMKADFDVLKEAAEAAR
jgi:TRAP-type C4-dicarboxylate transport system substrate-binding protein